MARRFSQRCVHIFLLSMLLQTLPVSCLRRLTPEADDIRSLLSSALSSKPSPANNSKRDTSHDLDLSSVDSSSRDDVASESRDDAVYEDEVEDDDSGQQQQRDLEDSEYKRSVDTDSGDSSAEKSSDQVDLDAYDDSEVKDVAKRETKDDLDYDEDSKADASLSTDVKVSEVRSTDVKNSEDLNKNENRRDASADEVSADLNFEKQIEDQIQQRIDSIKEDIKREIERKQQVREIEANNAKYDEMVLGGEVNEVGDEVSDVESADASKRSIPRNADDEVSEIDKSGQSSRSKRSDLGEVTKNENNEKGSGLVLPVKKRSPERQVTLVEKRGLRGGRRNDRASILIPERGHAEVKDELPADLTLGSDLRVARSNNAAASGAAKSARSVENVAEVEVPRYRRDMVDEAENEESREGDFLFAPREKPECRMRRRRSRGREKARKHPARHSRRHRAVRASSMDDEELQDDRDKRAMSLDEDAALEYKESFGGFQSDTSGGLGRFKRIRRSTKIS